MFFPPTSFHTFFIMLFAIPFIKAQPLFSDYFSFIKQKVLHNLGGVKVSVISNSAYYVADLIHSLAFQLYKLC